MINLISCFEKFMTITILAKRFVGMLCRVSYIKGPRGKGRTFRHYVFFDHRYQLVFRDVADPQPVMSTVLGSLSGDASAMVDFSWHYPGTGPFKADNTMKDRLEEGYEALQRRNEPIKYGRRAFAYHKKFWNQGFCGPNRDPSIARENQ